MLKSNVTQRAFLVCLKKTEDIHICPWWARGKRKKYVVCSIEAILVFDLFRVYAGCPVALKFLKNPNFF